jgi:hypothetical protein
LRSFFQMRKTPESDRADNGELVDLGAGVKLAATK